MIKLEEYRGVTIEDIMEVTGLENPHTDQSRYSLARQKELLLKEAKKLNIIHKVKKSHPIEYQVRTIVKDKDLEILVSKPFTPQQKPSSILNLNQIPHKVIRENNKVIIEVNKGDIPNHIFPKPGPGYSYHVIGILAEEKCYNEGVLFEDSKPDSKRLGMKYQFGFHNKVKLHILD